MQRTHACLRAAEGCWGGSGIVRRVCHRIDDVPGRAADAVRIISNADISITYMYTFLFNGKGILIFRTDNTEGARETIILNSLKFIGEKDLTKWV